MTAGQTTRRLNGSLANASVAALLAVALLEGAAIGAGITMKLASSQAGPAAIEQTAGPVGELDGAAFRAGSQAAGGYDGAGFRNGPAAPNFDPLGTQHRDRIGGP